MKCQNISDEAYALIQENEGVHWYCISCNRGVSKLLSFMSLFQERQDKMDKEMKVFKNENKKEFTNIKGEITKIRKNQGELNEIKSELAQFIKLATETDTKLETMVEAKLMETKQTVSQQVDDKVRDMKDDLSESLEIEKKEKQSYLSWCA